MNMNLTGIAFFLAGVVPGIAAEPAPAATGGVRAYLISRSGDFEEVWIVSSDGKTLRCRSGENGGVRETVVPEGGSIYFFEPRAMGEAMALYRARKYKEARDKFAEVREACAGAEKLPGNPSTLAGFHELECYRQLDDLEGLAKGLETFRGQGLVREDHLRQLEVYMFWNAVRTKDWKRLDTLVVERADESLPGGLRAQIACCHGMALENLGRPIEALDAYQAAVVADGGASESVAREAALHALRIYKADPDVQTAIRRWGTEDEALDAAGRARLLEAAALAKLFEETLGAGQTLPGPYREFLKYRPAQAKR